MFRLSTMKVLVSAYACSPNMGSEPGMGWNWCVNLAKHCELHIITEGEFRDKIEEMVPTLVQGVNMHFYYLPLTEKVRRMCWNQGDWRFYYYYRKWQKKTLETARKICEDEDIDILHQLNMIGFREPGYLWKISQETGIPFVWGPVDAKESFPMAYAAEAPWKTRLFLRLKNGITRWQLRYNRRVKEAVRTSAALLSASSNSVYSFKKYFGIDSPLFNETGLSITQGHRNKKTKNSFDILWVGKSDFRKQLSLALKAIKTTMKGDLLFHIVGIVDELYKKEADKLCISDHCVFHGAISHNEVLDVMNQADVLLFTSVAEGTPHVVLEAISCGLPIICFKTCGQGDCVTDDIGIKIPLTNPAQSVLNISKAIEYLYYHRNILTAMSKNCQKRAEKLSWESKAQKMVLLYEEVLKKNAKAV